MQTRNVDSREEIARPVKELDLGATGGWGDFPTEFLWGAATSSHQVEGYNERNDWWEAELEGRVPVRSGAACDHYRRYEADFDMARDWGHTAHRFSIEWSRVEPTPGRCDSREIRHYVDVVRALRDRGMEPIVTLHHFTNPLWFARSGGWIQKDAPTLFARYVRALVAALVPHVRYWITVNEPLVYVTESYLNGQWPPFGKGQWRAAFRALRNVAAAHVSAYQVIHELRSDAMVSFAHNAPVVQPCRAGSLADRLAACVRDFLLNRLFFLLVPPGNLDFIGLNYYTRTAVRSQGWGLGRIVGRACHAQHHPDQGEISLTGWECYPAGLTQTLRRFAASELPLIITENGVATDDEELRQRFVLRHVGAIRNAIHASIPVLGYLYWSLMDNFEWRHGYAAPFGLAATETSNPFRRPRACAFFMRRLFGGDCRLERQLETQSGRERKEA